MRINQSTEFTQLLISIKIKIWAASTWSSIDDHGRGTCLHTFSCQGI